MEKGRKTLRQKENAKTRFGPVTNPPCKEKSSNVRETSLQKNNHNTACRKEKERSEGRASQSLIVYGKKVWRELQGRVS